jgi:hypothetical protein
MVSRAKRMTDLTFAEIQNKMCFQQRTRKQNRAESTERRPAGIRDVLFQGASEARCDAARCGPAEFKQRLTRPPVSGLCDGLSGEKVRMGAPSGPLHASIKATESPVHFSLHFDTGIRSSAAPGRSDWIVCGQVVWSAGICEAAVLLDPAVTPPQIARPSGPLS